MGHRQPDGIDLYDTFEIFAMYESTIAFDISSTGKGFSVGSTVMRIIKLNFFPVPVRFRSGFGKLKFDRFLITFCDI